MKTIIEENGTQHHSTRTIIGGIILVIGGLLLIDQLNLIFIPDWLFSWPIILIAVGIYTGVKHNFRNRSWFIFTGLGVVFLLENSGLFIGHLIWPAAIILFGIYIILRRTDHDILKDWPDNNNSA